MTAQEIDKLLENTDIYEIPNVLDELHDDNRASVRKILMKHARRYDNFIAESIRMDKMWQFERQYPDCDFICGIDEVGRGPLAGPVMAGAVILPKDCGLLYINDSKQLTEKKREELYDQIAKEAVSFAIGVRDEKRIDEINILNATYEAMQDAIHSLKVKPDILLNDAVTIPKVKIRQVPIIKGDAKSASIAAASIMAKVTRDRFMVEMDQKYPGYGFAENKGYGSQAHIAALKELGPCEIHRRSFIKNFVEV